MGVAPFETRRAFHAAKRHQVLGESDQQLLAQVRVSDFAPAELNHRLHAIALFQEANGVVLS